jgi:hypothetical protein
MYNDKDNYRYITMPDYQKEGEHIAGRTKKEYNKKYYENNKDYFKEYNKQYYENNKDQLDEYNKKYYENNKELIKELKKNWYEKNKEKFSEKFNCECGGKYIFQNKTQHFKTKKHTKFMNSQQEQQPRK